MGKTEIFLLTFQCFDTIPTKFLYIWLWIDLAIVSDVAGKKLGHL